MMIKDKKTNKRLKILEGNCFLKLSRLVLTCAKCNFKNTHWKDCSFSSICSR